MRRLFDPEGAFWNKVNRSGGQDACWLWTRAIDGTGYGAVKVWGKKLNAHRYCYELINETFWCRQNNHKEDNYEEDVEPHLAYR